jgi:nucleotide-binding universal stress UspA family protein
LLHQTDLPLLIVPAGEHAVAGPLVMGYDGSDDARAAIATLGRLFPGREAVIAHAWDWPLTDTLSERALMAMPMVRASEVVDILKETAEDAAREVAEEGRALAEQHGLLARVELRQTTEGEWRALLAAAADLSAAVLAAGSRGRGGVTASLLGSVSTALAHHAERPTLIVRPAG